MVYFRRGRKRYSRRSRRLTKANIYLNRSAKSQSKQIAALNRKVNILTKANRPEIQTMYNNFTNVFTNSSLSSNWTYFALNPWASTYTGDDVAQGSLVIDGNYVKCKGISVKLISQYSDNWRDTIADESHDPSAGYRIVILQRRIAAPISQSTASSIQLNDVFNSTSTISSADTNLTLPLVSGINATFKVLYSKMFTVNRYHPTRQHNIYIPGNKCLDFVKDVSTTTTSVNCKGQLYLTILTGGLHRDVDYTAQISISGTMKIAFTDN